jgi:hypothetical protein
MLAILLAAAVGMSLLAVLAALMPWLMLVVVILFVIVGLQYLVWGWWLGQAIRRQEADANPPG